MRASSGSSRSEDASSELLKAQRRIAELEAEVARLNTGSARDTLEHEELFRLIIKATSDVVWDWNILSNTIHWSPSIQKGFGYALSGIEPDLSWWKARVHPDDRERVVQSIQAAFDGNAEYWEAEYRFLHAGGQYVTVLDRGYILRNPEGAATRMLGAMLDVTGQRNALAALRHSEERFRTLANHIPQLVWSCTPDGECDYLSPQWISYTGVPEDVQLGSGWLQAIHPEDRPRLKQAWQTSMETGTEMDVNVRLRRGGGTYEWFQNRAAAMRSPDGAIVKWFGTSTNVEDLKRVEESLRRSNSDLQQFAYVASHDLQEPLRTVSTYAELLSRTLGTQADEKTQLYLKYVASGALRMSALIRDLLAYARVAHDHTLENVMVDLGQLCKEVLQDLDVQIHETGASITCTTLPVVKGNSGQLRQVLLNLIGNALKYRKVDAPPVIRICSVREGDHWRITIEDDGQGFRPEYAERIFRIFKRLHGNELPGNGIGLAICKTIIERHGGSIWAEGELGRGAMFHLTLPVSR